MTEIRSVADTRHTVAPTQVIGQLPPPPAPVKSQRTSIPQKQNSFKRETETSPGHNTQMPVFPHLSSVITCPVTRSADSVSSSPTDGPSSPKQLHSLSADKNWRIFQNQDGHLSWTQFEEGHHLLCNEEDSHSERHSSEDEFDIWCITDEQRDYYVNQFRLMQPDISGKITGSTAKEFFEKSKLPVVELSKIWQLSDVDKDGALSLEEFCTAMHLVVLRRNNIDLPEILPPSLVPRIAKKPNEIVHPPMPTSETQVQQTAHNQNEDSPKHTPTAEVVSPQNKEWTKFNDSPTSSLSSPGMKPVNFDFSAASVEQNPKIFHPVALRLSPEKQSDINSDEPPAVTDDINKMNTTMPTQMIHKPKPRKLLGPSLSVVSQSTRTGESEYDGGTGTNVSRELRRSSFSGTSCCRSNSLSHGVTMSLAQGPKKEPPPPPPPRPKHNHTRSSSLDLNKLGSTVPHFLGVPPAVPPRVSPSTATPQRLNAHGDDILENLEDIIDFADFSNFADAENLKLQLQLKSGAFEVYRKPFPSPAGPHANSSSGSETFLIDQTSTPAPADDSTALLVDIEHSEEDALTQRKRHLSAPPLALAATALRSIPHDRRELMSAIKAHRERNKMLVLLNNELNQELSEVMEERIALEVQLEHLKPFS